LRALRRDVLAPGARILRQVVGDGVPRRSRVDEGMELRPDPGVVVECAEPDRPLPALRPVAPEQARPADDAERLHGTVAASVDANQVVAGERRELLAPHPCLRAHRRARMLAAARAVAMVRADERRGLLEADAPAQAAPPA